MMARSIFAGLILFSQLAVSQPLFPDRESLLSDPNFPLSPNQVQEVKEKVHDLLPRMRPTKEVPVEFTTEGMFTSTFNLFDPKISIFKLLGGAAPVFSLGTPKGLATHQRYVTVTLIHEYAHSILQQTAEAVDSGMIEYVAQLKAQVENKELSESEKALLLKRHSYFIGYHELFADVLGFVLSEDPKIFQKVLHHAYGRSFGSFPERVFESPMKKSHFQSWKKSARSAREGGSGAIDAYSVFWPQRQAVVELLKAGVPAQQVAQGLAEVVLEGLSHVISAPESELDHEKLNSRFQEKAQEKFGQEAYRPAVEKTSAELKENRNLSLLCKVVYRG